MRTGAMLAITEIAYLRPITEMIEPWLSYWLQLHLEILRMLLLD